MPFDVLIKYYFLRSAQMVPMGSYRGLRQLLTVFSIQRCAPSAAHSLCTDTFQSTIHDQAEAVSTQVKNLADQLKAETTMVQEVRSGRS